MQVEKELAILQQLHHPHLVSFMYIADQGSRISIVMDWAGENLRVHRTVTQSQQYTEDVARYMMYQLTSALVYLHAKVGVVGLHSSSGQHSGLAVQSAGIAMVSTCRQLRLSTHAEGSSSADGGQHSSPCESG